MRSTAMLAQKTALHRCNLPETSEGVSDMVKALTPYIVKTKNMKPSEAHREAQAMCVGMGKESPQCWEWPCFVAAMEGQTEREKSAHMISSQDAEQLKED